TPRPRSRPGRRPPTGDRAHSPPAGIRPGRPRSSSSGGRAPRSRTSIFREPSWTAAHMASADTAIRRGDYDAALASLERARAVGEDSALVWRRIGLSQAGLRRWSAAASALRAAVARAPDMAESWHSLG